MNRTYILSLIGGLAALLLFAANTAFAMNLGTGGPTGQYFKMGNDLAKYCKLTGTELSVKQSGGTLDNLDGMLYRKKFSIAMAQEDVLQFRHRDNPADYNPNRLKAIAGMHEETVHILIPRGYEPAKKDKGFVGNFKAWGKNLFEEAKPVVMDITMLKEQEVGAWGGSASSARILSHFLGLNFTVREVKEADAGSSGLPLIIVGGAPYAPVEKLLATNDYKLVGLNAEAIRAKVPFYIPTVAQYLINGQSIAADTISVRALLLGKVYENPESNKPMLELADCIKTNLSRLADADDTSPNWASANNLAKKKVLPTWVMFGQ